MSPPAGNNEKSSFPVRRLRRTGFLLFTLAATLILVKLGFWQIGRGIEKAELLNTIVQRQQHIVTSPLQVTGDVRGTMVTLNGRIDSRNSLLLDNQTHNGQQGYRWFAPLFTGYGVVLLELGWVAAPDYRSELPQLPSLSGEYLVSGVADRPSQRVTLAEAEEAASWPARVQTVNLERFGKEIGESVLPWLIRVDAISQAGKTSDILPTLGVTHVWEPVVMKPEKHYAYALQWFGLALVVVIGTVIWWRRSSQ